MVLTDLKVKLKVGLAKGSKKLAKDASLEKSRQHGRVHRNYLPSKQEEMYSNVKSKQPNIRSDLEEHLSALRKRIDSAEVNERLALQGVSQKLGQLRIELDMSKIRE